MSIFEEDAVKNSTQIMNRFKMQLLTLQEIEVIRKYMNHLGLQEILY